MWSLWCTTPVLHSFLVEYWARSVHLMLCELVHFISNNESMTKEDNPWALPSLDIIHICGFTWTNSMLLMSCRMVINILFSSVREPIGFIYLLYMTSLFIFTSTYRDLCLVQLKRLLLFSAWSWTLGINYCVRGLITYVMNHLPYSHRRRLLF